jgi:ankyrin repeat protein
MKSRLFREFTHAPATSCFRPALMAAALLSLTACVTTSPYSRLRDAVEVNDIRKADKVIDANSGALNECSALWLATQGSNLNMMKYYMQTGTPNCHDEKGFTVLMLSAKRGFTGGAQLLVDSGANVNLRSDKGWTAVDYAAYEQHFLVWDLLRQHGGTATLTGAQLANAKARQAAADAKADVEAREDAAEQCQQARQQEQQCMAGGGQFTAICHVIANHSCG